MPRFAILTHDHPHLHWDFLLEFDGCLRSWRLERAPDGAGSVPATAIPDHRILYLDYEGPIGDGRGTVTRWDTGSYVANHWTERQISVEISGDRLRGSITLVQIDGLDWRLEFRG